MNPEPAGLIEAAREARRRAHAPYSGYAVGAAILTGDGSVFTGANVENASYGLTVCAERVALFSAVAAGHRDFRALAVVAEGAAVPCGACLQTLAEFTSSLTLLLADPAGPSRTLTLADLLPDPFVFRRKRP